MSVSAQSRDEVARATSLMTDDNELSGSSPTLASDLSPPEPPVPGSGSNERDAAASMSCARWGPDHHARGGLGVTDTLGGSPSGLTDHDQQPDHHRAGDELEQHRHRVQHGRAHEHTTTEAAGRRGSLSDTGAFTPTAQKSPSQIKGGPFTTQNYPGMA